MKIDIDVTGFITTQKGFNVGKVRVQFTKDGHGKTLSVGNDNIQFTVPFEPIERIMK